MIGRIVEVCVRWRGLVLLAVLGILAAGVQIVRTMPIDAIPDLSDVQVIVFTEYPGQAPQVVEDQVTYPLVTALLAVPEAEVVRGQAVGVGRRGTPVRVADVARVSIGPDMRLGFTEWNGQGEAVGGVVVMRYGENALQVIDAVKEKIEEIETGLPPGVSIVPTYDRSTLIRRATATLTRTLIEESIVVALVCLIFLLHARSAAVAIAILPLGILLALAGTRAMGVNANIMSLGGIAIAIGAMIDAAIVMIENMHKHVERDPERPRWEVVVESTREVGPALFISLLIITLSFIPIFALQAEEGRLFRPLALTKTFSMAAAALLSITAVPVFMGFLIRGPIRPEHRNPVNRSAVWAYRPILDWALSHRGWVLALSAAALVATAWPLSRLGSEFMPPLDEGSLMYMPNAIPIVVPITLGIIALLLYFNFLNIVEVGIVMFSLPFALVGGVWLMWLLDYDFSVAVAVGFIALGGLAAQTGVVMLLYLDQAWSQATASGPVGIDRLKAAIGEGAVGRVRPKLMTVVAIVAGLLPLMWAHGSGASVIQRIAAPMIGGMITSTVLTLVVIPVLYYLWRRREVSM